MSTPEYSGPAQPLATPPSTRPGNGLGVAALVLGVASLVAAVSFILFPLGLLAGLVAAVLGGIAVTRGRTKARQPRLGHRGDRVRRPGAGRRRGIRGLLRDLCGAVTIRKSCGARPDIYGLTCTLTSSNHAISEYLRGAQHNRLHHIRQLHRQGRQSQRRLQLHRPPRERHPALGSSQPGRPVASLASRADHPIQRGVDSPRQALRSRAERRLSGAVPVYAAPDQDVCGVDMSLNSVHAVAA